jgi:hypothetical protein
MRQGFLGGNQVRRLGINIYNYTFTGKTLFLSYVLICRLQLLQPTVYCGAPGHAHVFSGEGVKKWHYWVTLRLAT